MTSALCVAPLGTGKICGALATSEREIEGLICPLCARHAAELDARKVVKFPRKAQRLRMAHMRKHRS